MRFQFDLTGANTLDVTDTANAAAFGYSGQHLPGLGQRAVTLGSNVIKYQSMRGPGVNYAFLDGSWATLLVPLELSPLEP